MANPLVTCVAEMYGKNHPQLKQAKCVTHVLFSWHGGCLATHACAHTNSFTHVYAYTHTKYLHVDVFC